MTAHGTPCERGRMDERTDLPTAGSRLAGAGTKGFTMVEILVAMVLAGFGVLGFTGLLKVVGNLEAEDTWKTKALFCAEERLEELTFESVTGKGFPTEGQEDLEVGSYQGMHRKWSVEDSAVFDGLLKISVECAYPWKGSMKRVRLSTLVFPQDG